MRSGTELSQFLRIFLSTLSRLPSFLHFPIVDHLGVCFKKVEENFSSFVLSFAFSPFTIYRKLCSCN